MYIGDIFYHEGMPCLWVEGYKRGGLSCDWSQWEGR
jgi:hypothetical protein